MKPNIGTTDKIIRFIIAAVIAVLYFTNVIQGALGLILLIAAGALVITSLISFCGLYTIFGISTCHRIQKTK